jgi:hypothetical protein
LLCIPQPVINPVNETNPVNQPATTRNHSQHNKHSTTRNESVSIGTFTSGRQKDTISRQQVSKTEVRIEKSMGKKSASGLRCSVTTDEASIGRKRIEPVPVTFPQGVVLGDDNGGDFRVGLFGHVKSKKRRLAVANNGKVELIGKNFGGDRSGLKPLRYLVLAYDPSSKRARLLNNRPISQYTMALRQSLDASIAPEITNSASEAQDEEGNSSGGGAATPRFTDAQRRKSLIETFGSQKKKREVKAFEIGRLDAERVEAAGSVQAMLNEYLSSTLSGAKEGTAEARKSLLPKFDLTATEASEAYPLDDLVTLEQRSALSKLVTSLAKSLNSHKSMTAQVSQLSLGKYCTAELHALSNAKTDKKIVKSKLRVLLSIHYAVRMYRFKHVRKPADEIAAQLGENTPVVVISALVDRFSSMESSDHGQPRRVRTKRDSDRLMMHTLVLALHFADQVVRMDALALLALDLGVGANDLNVYLTELGAKIVGRAADRSARLDMPLTFPKQRGTKKAR